MGETPPTPGPALRPLAWEKEGTGTDHDRTPLVREQQLPRQIWSSSAETGGKDAAGGTVREPGPKGAVPPTHLC